MTTMALTVQLDLFAEELPEHAAQLASYEQLGLDRREAFGLEVHAAKILTITRKSVLEIGQELLEARQKAKHGSWNVFLQRIGIEERSAENYMNVARSLGTKPEIISALPMTALYELAKPSADPTVVEQIISEVEAGTTFKVEQIKQRLAGTPAPAPQSIETQPLPASMPPTLDMAPRQAPPALDMTQRPAPTRPTAAAVEIASEDDTPARPAPATTTPAPQSIQVIPTRTAPAQPPALTVAAPAAPAPVQPQALTIPAPVADDIQQLKLLAAKYHLLVAALHEIEGEMQLAAREDLPTISIHESAAGNAARQFLASPPFATAALMLAFSAVVEP